MNCEKFEYAGNFKLESIYEILVNVLQEENAMYEKTYYTIEYHFMQPETMLLTEEYYVVPTLDLIGLIGGTLGMFVGFSFYGTFADALSLALSILKKKKNAGKNFFLSPIEDYTRDYTLNFVSMISVKS